jgi:hypothetical protein
MRKSLRRLKPAKVDEGFFASVPNIPAIDTSLSVLIETVQDPIIE